MLRAGEVAERSIAAVLKTVDRKVRGFESHPLRHQGAHILAADDPAGAQTKIRRLQDAAGEVAAGYSGPLHRCTVRSAGVLRDAGRTTSAPPAPSRSHTAAMRSAQTGRMPWTPSLLHMRDADLDPHARPRRWRGR
jgi:hypothetical protein